MLGLALLAVAGVVPTAVSATVHTSSQGISLIEYFEGVVLVVQPDPVGVPTICAGITAADGPLPSHATRAQCERMLRHALAVGYEPHVRALFASHGVLRGLFNQHRFDALVSLTFNVGPGVLPRLVNTRDPHAIASRWLAYDHAGGAVLAGLVARRRAEAALFLSPMGRFELWPPREIHLVLSYDRLRGHPSLAAHLRRRRLQHAMRAEARHVARVARSQHDWLSAQRLVRYQALQRRIPEAHA
jgi:lysozyme